MMKVRFDRNTCTGCFACYVACIAEHHGPEEADARSFRRVEKVTDLTAGFQKNVCPGCIHCGKCINVCPSGALYREETYGWCWQIKKSVRDAGPVRVSVPCR